MKQGGKQPLLCFLYIYFMNNPNSTLCTEYNEVPQLTQTHQATNMTSMSMHNLFCADLDFIEVSVPGSAATGGKAITQEQDDFMLLPPPSDKEDGESDDKQKSAREHDEAVAKEIKDLIDRDQLGGDWDGTSKLSYFLKMKSKLEEDWWALLSANILLNKKRAQQQSWVSKASLQEFTKASRKSKKDSDIIMGWTSQGKQYMQTMRCVINGEEESGVCKKWENVYKKMCKVVELNKEEGLKGDKDGKQFEMEETLMYSEFVEV